METSKKAPTDKCIRIFLPFFLIIISIAGMAQPDIQLKSEIGANLASPMHITNAGDGSGRLFVSERAGKIKVFNSSFVYQGDYLDLTSLINASGEGGLLSIAFHPDFETNGCLFVHYSDTSGNIIVARYKTSTPASNTMNDPDPVIVLPISHPATNHFGGEMHFGPDGNLYISVGDGGGANDVNNNAQNLTSLLGKMLRITVATSGTDTYTIPSDNPYPADQSLPRNEIYAIGLRNPFRWSFDSANGDMWIGDVGQGAEEEIDHCPAAMIKGANFGWRCYEGAVRTPAYNTPTYQTECSGYPNFMPKYSYDHSQGSSVIGGVVYHGTKYPMMDGYYIGADYFSGIFHVIAPETSSGRTAAILLDTKASISDFGEGENGEIYAVSMSENSIFRFVDANVDPLPVGLITFTGAPNVEGVRLSWKTTMEENFSHFDIESSRNGKLFNLIGTVSGKNNIGGAQYDFVDARANAGLVYYRLKMTDIDGSFTYSKIIPIDTQSNNAPLVLPSLVISGTLQINITEPYEKFELIGVSGKTLLTTNISQKTGQLDIPISSFPAAPYIVRLSGGINPVYTQKVVFAPL